MLKNDYDQTNGCGDDHPFHPDLGYRESSKNSGQDPDQRFKSEGKAFPETHEPTGNFLDVVSAPIEVVKAYPTADDGDDYCWPRVNQSHPIGYGPVGVEQAEDEA